MKTSIFSIVVVFLSIIVIPDVNSQSVDCEKKINDVRKAILDSIDKSNAISLAVGDKDFQGLVVDSKYSIAGISVGSMDIDYNNCKLINPNIQIQFNILGQNKYLDNCPYVIVIEDSLSSKVLAVDLGSCSDHITPPYVDTTKPATIAIFGGIIAMATAIPIIILVRRK